MNDGDVFGVALARLFTAIERAATIWTAFEPIRPLLRLGDKSPWPALL